MAGIGEGSDGGESVGEVLRETKRHEGDGLKVLQFPARATEDVISEVQATLELIDEPVLSAILVLEHEDATQVIRVGDAMKHPYFSLGMLARASQILSDV